MSACPPPEELADLLAGRSNATTAAHLETCAACQHALDARTSGAALRTPSPGDSALAAPSAGFLDRVKQLRAAAPDDPPAIPGYELLGELGRGGAGAVYKARHLAIDRVVARKVLNGRATADDAGRLRAEAQAAGRLSHPGIVPVFEAGEWTPPGAGAAVPFVSMEYVAGGTLSAKIDRTPQPPRAAAELLAALADAVEAAHRAGIVHRDLKPANVLLDATSGAPKVADFGLARRLDLGSGRTHTGMILGTPSYMAPEQARGDTAQITPRTDVYGLGAILYELLTGRPPFQGPTALETVVQVAHAEPIPPRRLQPTVPRDLETICLKCLEKNPAKRYPSAAALGDDARRFLAGKPTLARPVGALGRTARLARRHPLPAALLLLLAGVIVASIAGLSYLYAEADRERRTANTARDTADQERRAADDARARAETEKRLADDARTAAQQSESMTAATNAFLLDDVVFAALPKGEKRGLGRDVSLLHAMTAAEARLPTRFAGKPLQEIAVRRSLGGVYYALLMQTEAARTLEAARALAADHAPPTR